MVECRAVKAVLFPGALNFHKTIASKSDQIEIDFGTNIFAVIQVGQSDSVYDSHADRRDAVGHDFIDRISPKLGGHGIDHGNECSGDGRRSGPSVGFDHVGINLKCHGAELGQVHDGSQTSPNQTLNFGGTAVGTSALAILGCAPRHHGVFSRQPTGAFAFEEGGNGVGESGGRQDTRSTKLDLAAPRTCPKAVAFDHNRTHLRSNSAVISSHFTPVFLIDAYVFLNRIR